MVERMWKKREPSCTFGGNVVGTTTMETSMEVPLKLNIELPYDPAIPLLGIYPDKIFPEKYTCIHIFIAAIFTIAKTWKQPKCPSTDEWIKKMWYIYAMEYYSAIKKNKIMPSVATWMELETLTLSEVRSRKTNTI